MHDEMTSACFILIALLLSSWVFASEQSDQSLMQVQVEWQSRKYITGEPLFIRYRINAPSNAGLHLRTVPAKYVTFILMDKESGNLLWPIASGALSGRPIKIEANHSAVITANLLDMLPAIPIGHYAVIVVIGARTALGEQKKKVPTTEYLEAITDLVGSDMAMDVGTLSMTEPDAIQKDAYVFMQRRIELQKTSVHFPVGAMLYLTSAEEISQRFPKTVYGTYALFLRAMRYIGTINDKLDNSPMHVEKESARTLEQLQTFRSCLVEDIKSSSNPIYREVLGFSVVRLAYANAFIKKRFDIDGSMADYRSAIAWFAVAFPQSPYLELMTEAGLNDGYQSIIVRIPAQQQSNSQAFIADPEPKDGKKDTPVPLHRPSTAGNADSEEQAK